MRLQMDLLVTELSKAWIAEKDGVKADAVRTAMDEDAGGLTAALERLANLVIAARTIV